MDIQNTFDRLAPRYDLFNRLISLGMDNSWRCKTLEGLAEGIRVLDLGCGTGDLSLAAARRLGPRGEVVGLDFSRAMLAVAERRYEALGRPLNGRFKLVQKSAEELPLAEAPFDLVLSGFVLRNLPEIDRVLIGVRESLKPGGEIRLLDFTEPSGPFSRGFFHGYMNMAGLLYGRLLFGKDFPAGYMAESARRFDKPEEFVEKLKKTGFKEARAERFWFGMVVLYKAKR
jgi:demethylmenaquinone methyltransferase / 2-methoxy-6-polyprenyl-1,4-benzoquinol methylase